MKVEVKNHVARKKRPMHPVLMKHIDSDKVVLFVNDKTGVCLNAGGSSYLGEIYNYSTFYDNDIWEPFTGTITLSND